jgi:hypothetical protein
MPMGVVHVRHVRMSVAYQAMAMRMGVRLACRIVRTMVMGVMRIVHVRMGVLHHRMLMFVVVLLGEMQPDAERHQ